MTRILASGIFLLKLLSSLPSVGHVFESSTFVGIELPERFTVSFAGAAVKLSVERFAGEVASAIVVSAAIAVRTVGCQVSMRRRSPLVHDRRPE